MSDPKVYFVTMAQVKVITHVVSAKSSDEAIALVRSSTLSMPEMFDKRIGSILVASVDEAELKDDKE